MDDREPLLMNDAERKLFENTKAFVSKTCPKLPDEQRIHVVARVYEQMRFVTALTSDTRGAD